MDVHELRGGHLETITVRLRDSEKFGPDLQDLHEVALRYSTPSSALLAAGTSVWAVEGVGRVDRDALSALAGDRRSVTWVNAIVPSRTQAVLRCHHFVGSAELPGELVTLAIDEKIVEQVERLTSRRHTEWTASAWLADRAIVAPSQVAALSRLVVVAGDRELSQAKSFRVLGAGVAVEVRAGNEGLLVSRLVSGGSGGNPEGARLLFGRFAVVPVSELVATADVSPLLGAVLARGSYFELWDRYNALELRNTQEVARQLGAPRFARAAQQRDGSWRFDLIGSKVQQFLDQLGNLDVRDQEVEATEDDPTQEWLEVEANGGSEVSKPDSYASRARTRRFKGAIERIDRTKTCVYLQPLTDQGDEPPPRHGFLALATAGSRVVHRRRRVALERLAFGTSPLPQLGPLLQAKPVIARRTGPRIPWKSDAAVAAFGGEPTPAQQRAIDVALNTPDIAVIQGPPGTGKTRVIAAIASRLAEDAGPRDQSRLVLLSSFQHDAVDNVAAHTEVFGLPTVKEGTRRGSQDSWMAGWRLERLAEAARLLEERQDATLSRLMHWLREQHHGYVSAPLSQTATAELLRSVAARSDSVLSPALQEALHLRAQELDSEATLKRNRLAYGKLATAVRAIRFDPVSFADDGPVNAAKALARLKPHAELLVGLQSAPLELAASWNLAQPLDPVLAEELGSLREALLDRIAGERLHTASPLRDERATELLTDVLVAVEDRAARDGAGVAGVLARLVSDLESDPEGVNRALATYASVIAATCQGAGSLAVDPRFLDEHDTFDTVIVDEAARANPLDLLIPATLARRRVILVGDQRQLPHIVDAAIEEELVGSESEGKMVRDSLFGRLYDFLRETERRDGFSRVVTLNRQFRMHPVLGAFVSATFYEPHGEPIESPRPPDEFVHDLPSYEHLVAAWHHVPPSGPGGREERHGDSVRRVAEARWVATEVKRLMDWSPKLSFGVITFYAAQRDAILEELEGMGVASRDSQTGALGILDEPWRLGVDSEGNAFERLRVGTVDAFQGKEFDVCLLSAVRSPRPTTEDPRRAFGHLMVANRLCVSMSRQQRLLIVAGDRGLLDHKLAEDSIPGLVAFGELCHGGHGAFR